MPLSRVQRITTSSFGPVWEEVGEVISNPVVEIREEHYTLDIVFGSDYKV